MSDVHCLLNSDVYELLKTEPRQKEKDRNNPPKWNKEHRPAERNKGQPAKMKQRTKIPQNETQPQRHLVNRRPNKQPP